MARYTGPKTRIARKFGEAIFGADKVLSKKNYPPGQHGNNRRRKTSEYGVMLAEKQKAKYTYGVLEKQFRNMFEKAASMKKRFLHSYLNSYSQWKQLRSYELSPVIARLRAVSDMQEVSIR